MPCTILCFYCGFFPTSWRNKKCISNSHWVIDICIVYWVTKKRLCKALFSCTYAHTHIIYIYILFDVQMVNNYFLLTWFAPNSPYVATTCMKKLKRRWNDFDCSPKDRLPRSNRVPMYVCIYVRIFGRTSIGIPCTTLLNNISNKTQSTGTSTVTPAYMYTCMYVYTLAMQRDRQINY